MNSSSLSFTDIQSYSPCLCKFVLEQRLQQTKEYKATNVYEHSDTHRDSILHCRPQCWELQQWFRGFGVATEMEVVMSVVTKATIQTTSGKHEQACTRHICEMIYV